LQLSVDHIHVGYDSDVDVLNGVSIRAQPGQLIAIIGPNGAGKSTLIKTICRFVDARSGSITLGGADTRKLRPDQLVAHGVGYLMEGHTVFPGMTVEDNLLLGAWVMRQDGAKVRAAVEEVFHRAPILQEKRFISAGLLSGGQQRILEIERLYLTRPTLILLDEPSLGLSPKLAGEMLERAIGFRENGAAVVLVDQNARRLAEVADYVYVMQLGTVRHQGTGAELLPDIDRIVSEFI
jgi:branched-chain amino acid transport system ATP-binding protein